MDEPSDHQLVLRALQGDTQAYGHIVQRYQNSVFNVCYRMMGERRDAEDQAQEAFIRAYERLASFDVSRSFGPWIRRVATNLCLNALQKNAPVRLPLDDEHDLPQKSSAINPEKAQQQTETAAAIRHAILELPPHYRAVIELRHKQGLSYKEIAATLNIPLSDVKSHLFRARKLLAKRLASYA